MPDPASAPFFRLEIASLRRHFSVLSFSATEAISQPYVFQLQVSGDEVDLASLMYTSVFLSFNGGPQGFHGQIQGATREHYRPGPACYRLTVGPRLTCLAHRHNHRVFEQMSATQIIAQVLKEHGLKDSYRFDLKKECRTRRTCFQHNESDLMFLQRLCAEESIHYHFHHYRRRHELVFSHGLRGFRRAPIAAWSQFEHQPRVTQFAVTPTGSNTEDDRRQQRAQGESTLPFVTSGLLLPLAGLPERDWNHMWLITGVEHRFNDQATKSGSTRQPYSNRFQAAPWEAGFVSDEPWPWPVVARMQRAWLTGAAGELQERDPDGRVQVQFEWARQGPDARHTTCWLPVDPALRLWSRGGVQVVVEFKVNNPDNPTIIATLHSGAATPLMLLGAEDVQNTPCVRLLLDWQSVPGESQRLSLEDGSKIYLERDSELLLQVGASQVRFDSEGMTLISPRVVLDSERPAGEPGDGDEPEFTY
ncbi:contractile injection system protein, VgrG/Pvc8 family [Pseudomonas alliivorans]|nr:contractile injection system protein, VgrG/Pvc8 family [Pseudomonas alliivorans]